MKLFEVETSEGTIFALGKDFYGGDVMDMVNTYLHDRFHAGSHPYIKSLKLVADTEENSSTNKLIL